MQKSYIGIVTCFILLLAGCGADEERESSQLSAQIAAQVWQSCAADQGYHKKVWDLDEGTAVEEDSTYQPVPKVLVGEKQDGTDSLHFLLLRDLDYAISFDAEQSSLQDKLTLATQGDTLIAKVLPEFEKSTPLQSQKKVVDPATGIITYLYTHTRVASWLYSMNRSIEVHFDQQGNYLHHTTSVETRVPLLSRNFNVKVAGRTLQGD